MVSKSKTQGTGVKKGTAKVRTLKVKKETIKDLSEREVKNIKGGAIRRGGINENEVRIVKGGVIPSVGVN